MTKCVSPWYNRTGWLGVKHQLTYLRTVPVFEFMILVTSRSVPVIKAMVQVTSWSVPVIKAMIHCWARSYDCTMYDQLLWETTDVAVCIQIRIEQVWNLHYTISRSTAPLKQSVVSHSNWSYIMQQCDRDRKWVRASRGQRWYRVPHESNKCRLFKKFAAVRAQELCESRGGRPGLPVLN